MSVAFETIDNNVLLVFHLGLPFVVLPKIVQVCSRFFRVTYEKIQNISSLYTPLSSAHQGSVFDPLIVVSFHKSQNHK